MCFKVCFAGSSVPLQTLLSISQSASNSSVHLTPINKTRNTATYWQKRVSAALFFSFSFFFPNMHHMISLPYLRMPQSFKIWQCARWSQDRSGLWSGRKNCVKKVDSLCSAVAGLVWGLIMSLLRSGSVLLLLLLLGHSVSTSSEVVTPLALQPHSENITNCWETDDISGFYKNAATKMCLINAAHILMWLNSLW